MFDEGVRHNSDTFDTCFFFATADAFSVLVLFQYDNTLSKEEASSFSGLVENWEKFDKNGDDKLNNHEIQS